MVKNRVSSDKGKSFDENFAVFAFRSPAKNAKIFPFFAKFRLNLFCEKLQNKKCKNFAKLYMQKFLGKQNAKFCETNARKIFCAINCFSYKNFFEDFFFLAKFPIIFPKFGKMRTKIFGFFFFSGKFSFAGNL